VAVDGRSGHTSSGIVCARGLRGDGGAHRPRRPEYSVIVTGRTPCAGVPRGPGSRGGHRWLKIDEHLDSDIADFGDTTSLAVGRSWSPWRGHVAATSLQVRDLAGS